VAPSSTTAAICRSQEALHAGVGTVYQDPQIVGSMTVCENILLGRFPTSGVGTLEKRVMRDAAKRLLEALEIHLDPDSTCENLSVADKQLLQIARAASFDTLKLLILDEPTASLTPSEVSHLFGLVGRLRKQGVSILFVSHKLDEVESHSDEVTVFRDGQYVAAHRRGEYTIDTLVLEMVGRDLEAAPAKSVCRTDKGPALSVRGLSGRRFRDVSFDVFPGEILGLFGLVGAGRTDLLRAIFGADAIFDGEILLRGKPFRPRHVQDAIAHGLSMVPEDRKGQALVDLLSVNENLNLATFRKHATWGVLNGKSLKDATREFVTKLGIKTASPDAAVSSLSGGNQQKVVIARWLAANPVVLMLDEPAAGIDIGAKSEIYRLMEELAAGGTPIIVVSSELPEILRLSHRVGVMREGRLVGVVDHTEATEERLLSLATLGSAQEEVPA
jgi:rhamnose transport system ATP-binding protein